MLDSFCCVQISTVQSSCCCCSPVPTFSSIHPCFRIGGLVFLAMKTTCGPTSPDSRLLYWVPLVPTSSELILLLDIFRFLMVRSCRPVLTPPDACVRDEEESEKVNKQGEDGFQNQGGCSPLGSTGRTAGTTTRGGATGTLSRATLIIFPARVR